jgi:hypothetical protein
MSELSLRNKNNIMYNKCPIYNKKDHPKKKLRGKSCMKAKVAVQIESTQIRRFPEQSDREVGPHERWPKTLKTKLSSRGAIRVESTQIRCFS